MSTPICPQCGGPIPENETLWVWMSRWYCSEKCARARRKQEAFE